MVVRVYTISEKVLAYLLQRGRLELTFDRVSFDKFLGLSGECGNVLLVAGMDHGFGYAPNIFYCSDDMVEAIGLAGTVQHMVSAGELANCKDCELWLVCSERFGLRDTYLTVLG